MFAQTTNLEAAHIESPSERTRVDGEGRKAIVPNLGQICLMNSIAETFISAISRLAAPHMPPLAYLTRCRYKRWSPNFCV